MRIPKFGSTRLANSNKAGILKPDADGYYEMVLGGLNAFNSAGEYYTLDGAIKLFQSSSMLMRRIQNGKLKGELGHPKIIPGMTNDDYLERILTIEETNVIVHIKELWLDHDFGKKYPQFNNPKLVAVMGKVCPSGPHATAFERSINNPHENVTFSIRGLTHNYTERGQVYRVLTTIVTFDNVTEQGINIAEQWHAPALESTSDLIITPASMKKVAERQSVAALENTNEIAQEALASINNAPLTLSELPKLPVYVRW